MTNDKRLPVIVDTTLRDGIQMPGVTLTTDEKTAILEGLAALEITEAEIGFAAQGTAAVDEMRIMCSRFPQINCSAWCRARRDDIDAAIESGITTVHISFPVSERNMRITGLSHREVLERLGSLVSYVRKRERFITIGAQDATRADPGFLRDFVFAAGSAGVRRVRIADTVGIATPASAAALIGDLHERCPGVPLEYHGHNDFGLAVAATLSAMEAGIEAVSVTVNGIGERAGNAALEEVLTASTGLYGYSSSMRLEKLAALCTLVADSFRVPLHPHKPISGSNAFRHESGIHCHGMLRDPLAYQPFAAETVGCRTTYSFGAQSGSSSLRAVMKSDGVPIDRKHLPQERAYEGFF